MREIVFALRHGPLCANNYVRERLAHIEGYAEVLFSTRKHRQYGGDEGWMHIRRIILQDCATVRRNLGT